jgi:hypothetical protein
MTDKCARIALMLLFLIDRPCQGTSVATVGDSFADSLYNAMRARPDMLKRYDLHLARWSRPIVGLTRTDYFDYTKWLRDSPDLGSVDVCLVQIGSNDMQSIPVSKKEWIAYGSPQWQVAYAARTREMAFVLTEHRCGQVIWVLQPGFEKRDAMACHRELVNEMQRGVLHLERTRVLELSTSEAAYGADKTHFNRAYVLKLGPALFQMVDTSCQMAHKGCLACHGNIERLTRGSEIFPLRSSQTEPAVPVWAPEHVGVECRMTAPKRVVVRRPKLIPRRRSSKVREKLR